MTTMSNLPSDLVEEVLSKVSMTSLRKVRCTCRKWNTLYKDMSFAKKHLKYQAKEEEFMAVMEMDFKVCLMRINLCKYESCIKSEGMLISIDDSTQIDISRVFHCDGLLLCIEKDKTRLVVWNPYNGQTRWTCPTYGFPGIPYLYALGYEQSSSNSTNSLRNHKILIFINYMVDYKMKIYDFNSDSWRVLHDVRPRFIIDPYIRGVSLKGNTYWFARLPDNGIYRWPNDPFLVCFDFTRERFWRCSPLPPVKNFSSVAISSVREEQLAILFQRWYTLDMVHMEIWITSKIESHMVSWNSKVFIEAANIRSVTRFGPVIGGSFLVNEEKKVAVVFGQDNDNSTRNVANVAYVVRVDGSWKKVRLGESTDQGCSPLACPYTPSLVQLH